MIVSVFLVLYLVTLISSMAGMEVFSWLCLLSFVGVQLFSAPKNLKLVVPKKALWLLAGFALASVASTWLDGGYTSKQQIYVLGLQRWILLFFGMSLVLSHYSNKWEKVFYAFLPFIAFISLYSIIQTFTGIDIFRSKAYTPDDTVGSGLWRAKGLFSNTMTYSYSLAFVACNLFAVLIHSKNLAPKKKFLLTTVFLLLLISLFFTFTRGLWLAIAFGLTVAAFYRHRRLGVAFCVSGLLLVAVGYTASPTIRLRINSVFDSQFESNQLRTNIWRAYWAMFKDRPIIGNGYRHNSQYVQPYFKKLNIEQKFVSHAHSNYLQMLSGTGFIGFLFYIGFFLVIYFYAHRIYYQIPTDENFARGMVVGIIGGLTSFHIGGLTESNFLDGEVRHMLVFQLSMLFAIGWIYLKSKPSEELSAKNG